MVDEIADHAKLLRDTQINRFVNAEGEAVDAELLVRQHAILLEIHPDRAPEVHSWSSHALQDARAKRERAEAIRKHAKIKGHEYPTLLPIIRARLENLTRQYVEHTEMADHSDVYGVDHDNEAFLAAQAKSAIDSINEWLTQESARLVAMGLDENGAEVADEPDAKPHRAARRHPSADEPKAAE